MEALTCKANNISQETEEIQEIEKVDDSLKTSSPGIYACGDCIGSYQFSHYAGWQAFQAVRSALLPGKGSGKTDVLPWCTFTDPEVARVGPLELEARKEHGDKLEVKTMPMTGIDRAVCEDDEGFIKLLHVGTKIVGATVVAERAGELINEIALAMKNDVGLDKLAGKSHEVAPRLYCVTVWRIRVVAGIEGVRE